MSIREEYDFSLLTNEAERLVVEEIERQITTPENESMCKCEDCILDIAAFALNNLAPRYRVSLLGTLYAKGIDQTDYVTDVRNVVQNAVQKVKTNPSHD